MVNNSNSSPFLPIFIFHSHIDTFQFLMDPGPISRYPCQWLTNWLTDSLTPVRQTWLAFEYANSKFVDVVSLLMLILRTVLKTVQWRFKSLVRYQIVWFIKLIFFSDYEHKVWSGFWSWSLVNILKLKFCQYLKMILF